MSVEADDLERLLRARVLIVEDEGIVAKDLRDTLQALGYTVCGTCATGADAVARAQALRPDLILMDIRLRGEIDGIEAARSIRRHLDIPIVFLTAYADSDTLRRAAAVGPYGYIVKPFEERELQSMLLMAMCKHQAFAELDQRVQQRTQELAATEQRFRRLQTVAELGLYALGTPDEGAVMARVVEVVVQACAVDMAGLLERQADGSLLLRAGAGSGARLSGCVVVRAGEQWPDVLQAQTCAPPPVLAEHGAVSGMSAVIQTSGNTDSPWGVLFAYSHRDRLFTEDDLGFLQSSANVVATAILRVTGDRRLHEAERAAEKERVRAYVAEEGLRARDEFLSVASHELRTPVTALQLQLEALFELLSSAHEGDPRIPLTVGRARSSVARLAELVESVLDVSRIAVGKLELKPQQLDLAVMVRDVVARHEALARRAGCQLRVAAAQSVLGTWDPIRIEQVISNLLSNAIKFGAGMPIDVRTEKRGGVAILEVRDHGEGMHQRDAERILGRFERAVSHRRHGGLGLGLYIANQIVTGHGGMIEVASAPSKGATFTIILPTALMEAR